MGILIPKFEFSSPSQAYKSIKSSLILWQVVIDKPRVVLTLNMGWRLTNLKDNENLILPPAWQDLNAVLAAKIIFQQILR